MDNGSLQRVDVLRIILSNASQYCSKLKAEDLSIFGGFLIDSIVGSIFKKIPLCTEASNDVFHIVVTTSNAKERDKCYLRSHLKSQLRQLRNAFFKYNLTFLMIYNCFIC